MKRSIVLLILLIAGLYAKGQSVIFYSNQVRYDQKPLLMNGIIGNWTNSQYVQFSNQTSHSVNIRAHLHSYLNFIYFINSENKADDHINVTIPAGRKYTLQVIAKLVNGNPIVYSDELGFDITYQDNRTSYFELNASVYFYHSNGNSATTFYKPQNYGYIGYGYKEVSSGKPMRWDKNDLPLAIYSNHTSYGFDNTYSKVIQRALDIWNVAGRSVGIATDIFRLANDHNNADIGMDWSGQVLEKTGATNALGVALPGKNIIGMWPLQTYNNYFRMTIGDVGETLVQELGHLLGPIHSDVKSDIMNGSAHGHFHDLSQIEISDRDRQMLGWIYSQENYFRFTK